MYNDAVYTNKDEVVISMKISFSTLACPDFSWTDIYTMAKDLGFGGIEIRGLGEDIFAVNARRRATA